MSDNNTIIRVNGLEIKEEAVYKVTGKPDSSAPSGFIKEGVTKLPSLGIGNSVPVRYVITNKAQNKGVFDTGLYEESPCYATLEKDVVKNKVKLLREKLVEPYERKYGVGLLNHNNEDFWLDYNANLFDGRFFVTNKVDDLLELYIAMMGYELTPKDQLGNPKFRDSQYCVEDKEKVRSIKDERANKIMDAISRFSSLYETDPTRLFSILRYIQLLGMNDKINPNTLKSIFFEWLNKSETHIDKFNKAYKLSEGEGKDEIELYYLISKLAIKKALTKESGVYMYKGHELGADLKTSAKNINSKSELQEVKIELLELDYDEN